MNKSETWGSDDDVFISHITAVGVMKFCCWCVAHLTMINVVHVIQVKVHLEWRLKLIVMMMSLSIHMMTSQGRICVQCVINGLQRNKVWLVTEWDTLEKTCIHVLSVKNVFHLRAAYMNIWTFIAANTSAQNVANVVVLVVTWQDTNEVIQESNRLNVLFVANDLHRLATLLDTIEFTVERNHTNVTCVTRHLVSLYS